ncbi:MAG: hypothetical protein AAFQ41_03055 [Cyanobacteria bacterium J06623_7]
MIMLQEVKIELVKLGANLAFARNLTLTFATASLILCGLAELQSQSNLLTERNSITDMSNSSSTKVIVERK